MFKISYKIHSCFKSCILVVSMRKQAFLLEYTIFSENIRKIGDFCSFSLKIKGLERKLKKCVYPHHLDPVIAINPIFGQDRLLGGL